MKIKTHKVMALERSEFSTREVWKSGDKYFVGTQNGGSRGARQPASGPNGNWGFWHNGPTEISESEALSICSEMGIEEVEI